MTHPYPGYDPHKTAGRTRRALNTITENYDPAANPPRHTDDSDNTRGGDPVRPPANLNAIQARKQTHESLKHWASWIIRHVNHGTITHRPGSNMTQLIKFIDTWALELAEQNPSFATQCARCLEQCARTLRGIAHGTRTRRIEVGPCPEAIFIIEGELETLTRCDGTVVAVLTERDPDNEEDGLLPHHLTCTTSPDHTWQPWQWADIGKRIERMGA